MPPMYNQTKNSHHSKATMPKQTRTSPVYYCSVLLPENTHARLLNPIEKQNKIELAERVAKAEAIYHQPASRSKEDFYLVSLPRGVHRIPIVNLSNSKKSQPSSPPIDSWKDTSSTLAKESTPNSPPTSYLASPPLEPKQNNKPYHINTAPCSLGQRTPVQSPAESSFDLFRPNSSQTLPKITPPQRFSYNESLPVSPLCPPPHLRRERRTSRAASVPEFAHPHRPSIDYSSRRGSQSSVSHSIVNRPRPKSMLSRMATQDLPEERLSVSQSMWLDQLERQIKIRLQSTVYPSLSSVTQIQQEARQFWEDQRRAMQAFSDSLIEKIEDRFELSETNPSLQIASKQTELEKEVIENRREILHLQRQLVEFDLLKPRHAELEAQYEAMGQQAAYFQKEWQESRVQQSRVVELEAHLKILTDVVEEDCTKQRLDEILMEKAQWKAEMDEQIKAKQTLKDRVDELQVEVCRNHKEMNRLGSRNQQLETDLECHQRELERLQAKCEYRTVERPEIGMADCGEEFGQGLVSQCLPPPTNKLPETPAEMMETIGRLKEENRKIKQSESVNKIQLDYMQRELNQLTPAGLKRHLERKDEEILKLKRALESHTKQTQPTTISSIPINSPISLPLPSVPVSVPSEPEHEHDHEHQSISTTSVPTDLAVPIAVPVTIPLPLSTIIPTHVTGSTTLGGKSSPQTSRTCSPCSSFCRTPPPERHPERLSYRMDTSGPSNELDGHVTFMTQINGKLSHYTVKVSSNTHPMSQNTNPRRRSQKPLNPEAAAWKPPTTSSRSGSSHKGSPTL
ncbi:hypothetical protein F4703DRAFT_1915246 [Phycomyces blakesleeanus]